MGTNTTTWTWKILLAMAFIHLADSLTTWYAITYLEAYEVNRGMWLIISYLGWTGATLFKLWTGCIFIWIWCLSPWKISTKRVRNFTVYFTYIMGIGVCANNLGVIL